MLRHTDNLSKTLQAIPMCASEEARITATTVTTLQALRFGDQFPFLQYHVIKGKQESKVQNPELPRRKMTCRFENSAPGEFPTDFKEHYRQYYFGALDLDLVINAIQERFGQPDFHTYQDLEEPLLQRVHGEDIMKTFTLFCQF